MSQWSLQKGGGHKNVRSGLVNVSKGTKGRLSYEPRREATQISSQWSWEHKSFTVPNHTKF